MLFPFRPAFFFTAATQSPSAGGGGGGGPLPPGATWHLNFVDGFYYAGGAEQVVGDVLGGAFNPTYLTGAGLDTQFTNDNRPDAIGALFTDIATLITTGMSVIIEIDGVLTTAELISWFDDPDPNSATAGGDSFADAFLYVEDFNAVLVGADRTSALVDGIHRIGVTWYYDIGGGNFESATCVNGETPVTDTTAYDGSGVTVATAGIGHAYDTAPYFWGGENDGFVIRSMTGYPAMSSADLAVLSGGGELELALVASAGSYSVTGSAAAFVRSRVIAAATGSYAMTGSAATLQKSGARLQVDAGSYAVTGATASILKASKIAAAAGSYAVTGASATLTRKDALYSSVKVLALFTGSNGSTTFTDQSSVARTLTANGNAQIQSNKLELDGVTDFVSAADAADVQLSGDFCLEFFGVDFDTVSILQTLASHYDAFTPQTNQRGWAAYLQGDIAPKKLSLSVSTLGTSASATLNQIASWAPSTGTPYDICFDRSGSTLRVFVGGVFLGSVTYSSDSFNSTSPLTIGSNNTRATTTSNQEELDGRMTAFRFTAASRHGSDSNYTVPPLPLPTA